MRVIVGVDIGGTQLKFGIFTEQCKLLKQWTADTDISDSGMHIIPGIAEEIRRWMRQEPSADVIGIGMGIPGPVDKNGYVRTCVNLNWHEFNPVEELKKEFPSVRIAAGNDANVAALGEYCQGAGKEYSSAMLITIGTGIGGGIVLNGEILLGAHGLAGEIGHISLDSRAEERCNCGNLGCIDHIASASGIVREMKKLLGRNSRNCVLRDKETFTAKEVCDAASAGDRLSLECIDLCMEPLAKGMAFFSHAFDPEVFMIGGGVSEAGRIVLDPLEKHYRENLFLVEKGADIRKAVLGNQAGMIGACMLAAQEKTHR